MIEYRKKLATYIIDMTSSLTLNINRNNLLFLRRMLYVNKGMYHFDSPLNKEDYEALLLIAANLNNVNDVVYQNIQNEKELWEKTGVYLGVYAANLHKPWCQFLAFTPKIATVDDLITQENIGKQLYFGLALFKIV